MRAQDLVQSLSAMPKTLALVPLLRKKVPNAYRGHSNYIHSTPDRDLTTDQSTNAIKVKFGEPVNFIGVNLKEQK